jgi:hypothetical protein
MYVNDEDERAWVIAVDMKCAFPEYLNMATADRPVYALGSWLDFLCSLL